ncbi:hypothetical protein [Actinomadura rugatobispora]|uniref:DUF4383 domain-containing protein n=1 Tax=Actinomadura rugatobispora TaxID=1994 RepID=A0ABW0ZQ82_9ACTN|nr:hypothetical protein GCM10010200_034870 [Actinomadura rugatobispora]
MVALLGLHTAVLALGTSGLFMDASSKHEHGQDGAGPLIMLGVMCVGLTAALGLSAVQVMRGVPWGRYLALVLESLFLFGALIQFTVLLTAPDLIGGVVTVVTLAVIGAVIWLLSGTSREWFETGSVQPR